MQRHYVELYEEFKELLRQRNPQALQSIQEQTRFRNRLFELATVIKDPKIKSNEKKAKLQQLVSKSQRFDMSYFDVPKPMPIDPKVLVRGIIPEKCFVFKSAMCPLKLTFNALNQDDLIMSKKDQAIKQ